MTIPTTAPEVVITVGYPGSGKGTFVQPLLSQGYQCFNRDTIGGGTKRPKALIYDMAGQAHYSRGVRHFVFDNTYGTVESRAAAVAFARSIGLPIRCLWLQTTLEQAQVFASRRQVQRTGKLLRKEDYKAHKGDPNMFPPGAQYAYRKRFEPPTMAEGFNHIEEVAIETKWGKEYVNRALFLDLDGTVRVTPDEKVCPWPRNPSEVRVILPSSAVGGLLQRRQREGWLILAVTNQSGVSRKPSDDKYVSEANVVACIEATEAQLGLKFDGYAYATDRGGPPSSFWRKPAPGMGVMFIEKHKLDPSKCLKVGDMTSDKTFAQRCGFQFAWGHEFFS